MPLPGRGTAIFSKGRRPIARSNEELRTPYSRDACVHQLFERQAARTPDAVALTFGDKEARAISSKERRPISSPHHLRKLGVRRGSIVGTYLERSLELFVGMLGVAKAGGHLLASGSEISPGAARLHAERRKAAGRGHARGLRGATARGQLARGCNGRRSSSTRHGSRGPLRKARCWGQTWHT